MEGDVELRKEQEASLARPPREYGFLAKLFFWTMDLLYGKELSYSKIRMLEILARIPYQTWEVREYHEMNREFSNPSAVEQATRIIAWSREAQDNEFWHLRVVDEKMKEEGVKVQWFRDVFIPSLAAFQYRIFSGFLAFLSMDAAFRLNADLEDHAEHEYMTFVKESPELDNQPLKRALISEAGVFKTWGDVFRKIGLDERRHMQDSLILAGTRRSE